MYKDAILSDCSKHRYVLTRRLANREYGAATFIMLNPSTADAHEDDPTIRRCIGFADSWGCRELRVINLFTYRATDPKELHKATELNNFFSNIHFYEGLKASHRVVCAWGSNSITQRRVDEVRPILDLYQLHCLGVNKDGSPKHPLYLPKNARLIDYRLR